MSWNQNAINNLLAGSVLGASPAAGYLDEMQSAVTLSSAAIVMPSQTTINVVSKPLAAGNWLIFGNAYQTSTVGLANFNFNLSTTSASLADIAYRFGNNDTASQLANGGGACMPIYVSSAVAFTAYLCAYGVITSGGTCTVAGAILALRQA